MIRCRIQIVVYLDSIFWKCQDCEVKNTMSVEGRGNVDGDFENVIFSVAQFHYREYSVLIAFALRISNEKPYVEWLDSNFKDVISPV